MGDAGGARDRRPAAGGGGGPFRSRHRTLRPDAARPGAGHRRAPAGPAAGAGRPHRQGPARRPADRAQGRLPRRDGRDPRGRAGDRALGDGRRHRGAPRRAGRDHHARRRRPLRLVATRPSKSRLNFLGLLRAGRPDYVLNAAAAAYMLEHGASEAVVATLLAHERRSFADEAAWGAHLAALGLGAGHRRLATEAALVGSIAERGLLTGTVIVSDDAGQFDVLTHALCWVHAERHLRRLVCATAEEQRLVDLQRQLVWWLYQDLKLYKADPTAARRAALRARFVRVFGRVTGFAALDATVARLRANKAELLVVLDRPEIPLHTNGSESDIRCVVTKRKISGGTRSAAGKRARDTFLGLLKTCAKLGVSFWDYLGARLKIPEADPVPWLPDLIRQRASA